jgi:hypothetical protein
MGAFNIECCCRKLCKKGTLNCVNIDLKFLLASPYASKARMSHTFLLHASTAPSSCAVCVSLQTGRTVQEEPLPTLSYLVIWMLGLALVALIVLGTICLWKRKEMSKCVTRSSKSRQSSSGSVSIQPNLRGTLVRVGCSPEQISVC